MFREQILTIKNKINISYYNCLRLNLNPQELKSYYYYNVFLNNYLNAKNFYENKK